MEALGIDIGGSGIKGAPVEVRTGRLLAERFRLATPKPASPAKVARVIAKIVSHFDWHGAVGVGFPGVIKTGRVLTAANLSKGWLGIQADELLQKHSGCGVQIINDADAAGIAEMTLGAGQNRMGKVILLTFGTGIGSALFLDGRLVTNTEFGHLQLRGKIAEARAADRVRVLKKLSWKAWGERVAEYLSHLEMLFSPELFIIGGGASKSFGKFARSLKHLQTEVVPARHGNLAGILGAALVAGRQAQSGTFKPVAWSAIRPGL